MQTCFRWETGAKQAQPNLSASDVACREKTGGKKQHIQDVCHYFLTQRVFTVKRWFQFPLFFSPPFHTPIKTWVCSPPLSFPPALPQHFFFFSLSHESRLSKRSFCISDLCWLVGLQCEVCVSVSVCVCVCAHANGNILNSPRSSFWETQQQEWMF